MEVRETLWNRCLSTPIKPPAKNSNIWLSETTCQHKETRKKCKKTNQAAIIQWQRQCLMDKPHRKPWRKSKTSDISKHSPSPLHHTFLLGRARFTDNLYPPCKKLPALGTNQIAGFRGFRPLASLVKNKIIYVQKLVGLIRDYFIG